MPPLDYAKPKMDTEDLTDLCLLKGSHERRDQGLCVMEAAAWLAGEPHSAYPKCVSPTIRRFLIGLNDRGTQSVRNELKAVLPLILNTAGTFDREIARGYIAADFAVRMALPIAMEAIGKTKEAEELRSLPAILDRATAIAGRDLARKLRDVCWTAYHAAVVAAVAADAVADVAVAAVVVAADAVADAVDAAAADDDVDVVRERAWGKIKPMAVDTIKRMCAV